LNFTFDGLKAAATAIDRLRNFKLRLETDKFRDGVDPALTDRAQSAIQQFEESLDDDLNTAEALAALFEYVRDANTAMDSGGFRDGNAPPALAVLDKFDAIFDVLRPTRNETGISDSEVEVLIAERAQAKKNRDFKRSDQIRAQLLDAGIILEDTKEGARWKRK